MMKKTLCAVLFSATVASANTCDVPKPFRLLGEKEAQVFQQITPKPSENNLPKMVNLWATWCAPCRKELPFLQALSEEKRAQVTLINIEDKPADAEKVLTELNINTLTTRYDVMELLDKLQIQGLPGSILFHDNNTYLGVGVLKDEEKISHWLTCLQANTESKKIVTN